MAKDTTGRLRVTVKSGGRLKLSSKLWLERQLNDPYVARAKREPRHSNANGRAAADPGNQRRGVNRTHIFPCDVSWTRR